MAQQPETIHRQSGMTRSNKNTFNSHNPDDKHIQPWYPSPSHFHGKTEASDVFQKWDLPPRNLEQKQDEVYKSLPFTGTTTSGDTHRAFDIEPRKLVSKPQYVPNKAAFYGDTTSKSSYQQWDLPPREIPRNMAEEEYNPVPFRGRSTSQDTYQGKQLDPSQQNRSVISNQSQSKIGENSAKFYGETTSSTSYKKWDIPKQEAPPADNKPFQSIPFRGTTTSQDTYQAHQLPTRTHSNNPQSNSTGFQPNNAKFYGETTAANSYKQWPLPEREQYQGAEEPYKPVPFRGTTTSQDTYRKFPVEVRAPAQPIKYEPNKAYFYGSTTYGETFQAWELPRSSADESPPYENYTPPHIPFKGTTTAQDAYKAFAIEPATKPLSNNQAGSWNNNPTSLKFSGKSESMEQFKQYSTEELAAALPDRSGEGQSFHAPSVPFRGTSTSQDTFKGWQLPRQTMSVGIEIVNDGYYVMLPRSRVLPTKATHIFTTVTDNQSEVEIRILQGDSSKASECSTLGVFELVGIAKGPCGSPQVAVTLSINEDNVLHVDAVDRLTGVEHHMAIDREKNMGAFVPV